MAIFFLLAGLWLLEKSVSAKADPTGSDASSHLTMAIAGLVFAAAILSHFFALPLVAGALLASRVKSWRFWLFFGLTVLCAFALFADAGRNLALGSTHFAARWRFNGSLFELLVAIFRDEVPRVIFGGVPLLHARAKLVAVAVLVGVSFWAWHQRYRPARAAFAVTGAVLLLSPTVHPWYVAWIVALVCWEWSLAWLTFSALVIISYVARLTQLDTGLWVEVETVRWMEYAPFFLLLAGEFWRNRLRKLNE